jgi:hypothetical protein
MIGTRAAMIAVIVVLSVLVSARYGSESLRSRVPNAIILLLGAPPKALPAAIPLVPSERRLREVANA